MKQQIAIIDAHIHIWDLDRLRYPWLDGVPKINRIFHDNAKTFYRI